MNHPCLSPCYLARQEIRRRPWQFLLSACAVAVGVTVVAGCLVAVARERRTTDHVLRHKEQQVDERFASYGGELAEAMTKAGFHVVILPRDQELGDWYNEDFAAKILPEDAVQRLAAAPLETIEHLLPTLTGRLRWRERDWTVIVRGTSSTVLHPNPLATRFLDRTIPAGSVDVGDEIARAFALEAGQSLIVDGRSFRVRQCRPPTGTKDDITLHLSIEAAREVLGRPDAVNEIVGLEQPAAWGDIERIRAELGARLPEAQILEISNRVVATMRARRMAERESRALLGQEREHRQQLLAAHGRLALAASLAALAIGTLWLAVMTFLNLARRRGEIGLLAALGTPARGIRAVFLARVAFVAALGVILGMAPWLADAVGLGIGPALFWLGAVVVAALPPVLATVVVTHCQLARQDLAEVLKNEV